MIYIAKDDKSLYLNHHGILGQKWGKKNGPPYPLSSDISTGKSLKKEDKETRKAEKYRKREINKRNRAVQKELWKNSSYNEYGVRVYTQKAHEIDEEIQALKRMTPLELKNVKKVGNEYVKNYVKEVKESKKAAAEKRWNDYWSLDVNIPEWQKASTDIENKSVNWYNGEGKTNAQKALIKEYDKLSKKYDNDSSKWKTNSDFRKEREKIYEKVVSNALKDIGIPDTKDNREKYKYVIFWD